MNSMRENGLMLASLLGISEDEACTRLDHTVAITCGGGEAKAFADELSEIIGRTLTVLQEGRADVEVVVAAEAQGRAPIALFVVLSDVGVKISISGPSTIEACHPLFRTIAVCYSAGMAISKAVSLDKGQGNDLTVRFESLGVTAMDLSRRIFLEDALLVGAGAIGNGFLRALRHLNVENLLGIADPKKVSDGNINRCLYFDESSVGKFKAEELRARAQPEFEKLQLHAFIGTLHDYVKIQNPKRVRRVFVATDSRMVRRSVQSELPLEVVDASTTAADEIITHAHKFPTDDACLACVYPHIPDEDGRARDIATGLGVSLEDVQKGWIDEDAANRIAKQHKNVAADQIIGTAYDSLFKALCSADALLLPGGDQVLAPFAFVSCLAGALMAVELVRFDLLASSEHSNYFFTNPWRSPHRRARMRKAKLVDCEFCSKQSNLQAMQEVWNDVL
jgi:molybdopterin/thiamine biosynthesis adenylyltransferase